MWTSTRGRGSGSCGRMWTWGGGVKNPIFCGRHKWMAPNCNRKFEISTAPTKAKSREPAYSQSLVQNEIDWQRVRARASGKQTVRHHQCRAEGVRQPRTSSLEGIQEPSFCF